MAGTITTGNFPKALIGGKKVKKTKKPKGVKAGPKGLKVGLKGKKVQKRKRGAMSGAGMSAMTGKME